MNPSQETSGPELAAKFQVLDMPAVYSAEACDRMAGVIDQIVALKKEHNAAILAHNYQRPEIYQVADFVGDSLELAKRATDLQEDIIVFCGVHFMAESAKILAPDKMVLLPDMRAGCSLADSVDPDELVERRDELKKLYPDLQVAAYVNTTAAVKAVVDVCVTSSNAVKVVEALDSEHVLFVPDEHLASYVQKETSKTIHSWDGNCYVHHEITPEHIASVKEGLPDVKVLVHPECRSDVADVADAVLSTSGMVRYAKESRADEFLIVTECGLSEKLILEVPEKKFYKACKLCRFMKMITLDATLDSLRMMRHEITLDEDTRVAAEKSLRRMFALS